MLLRSFDFWISLVALCSCAEHAPPVEKPPVVAPASTASAPRIADAGFSVLADAQDAGGDDAGVQMVATPSQKQIIDPAEWLTAHGISDKDPAPFENPWGCEEVLVGTSSEPALVCSTVEQVSRKGRKYPLDCILEHRSAIVVRAKKLVKVLDVIVTLEPLDKPRPDTPNTVDLALHFAPDGQSAWLDEHTEFAGTRCAEARSENRKELSDGSPDGIAMHEWAAFNQELIARVCGGLGEFAWKKDKFERRKFTGALPLDAPKAPPREHPAGEDPFGF